MTGKKSKTPKERREDLCYEMFSPTRTLAVKIERKLRDVALESTLVHYDLGSWIAKISRLDQEPVFGERALEQIASFLAIPGGTDFLYDLRGLAQEFTRHFVEEQASKTLDNGRPFSLEHFLVLTRVRSKREQGELIERVRTEGLTARQLRREIDGRNVS